MRADPDDLRIQGRYSLHLLPIWFRAFVSAQSRVIINVLSLITKYMAHMQLLGYRLANVTSNLELDQLWAKAWALS